MSMSRTRCVAPCLIAFLHSRVMTAAVRLSMSSLSGMMAMVLCSKVFGAGLAISRGAVVLLSCEMAGDSEKL